MSVAARFVGKLLSGAKARDFRKNDQGAVALLFGLSILPLMGLVGVSVDYSRASQARGAAIGAADAAALEAVKFGGAFAERKQRAEATLKANLATLDPRIAYEASFTQIMKDGVEVAVQVDVKGSVPTALMGLFGVKNMPIAVKAEARNGAEELTDVAFVLDTTGSMLGSRLASLKDATTRLIDDFEKRRGTPDQIHVSVVPFAQYVNVGMANRNEPWIDVPPDRQDPVTRTCRMEPVRRQVNCRQVAVPATPGNPNRMCDRDGVRYSCPEPPRPAGTRTQCDTVSGPDMEERCSTSGGQWRRWTGCVGSRPAPLNAIDGNYANRIPGLLDTTCGQPLRTLSNDLKGAKTMINGLTASGLTYIPSGLFWGWATLSQQRPFPGRAATPSVPVNRYMVLVTDGENTRSQSGTTPFHNASSRPQADGVTATLCANMAADKESNITLYTIAFEITDVAVKNMLRKCSELNGGQFFDASNGDELLAAFQHIGTLMNKTRLSR
jgi:Flp pilus assembly protein TadG